MGSRSALEVLARRAVALGPTEVAGATKALRGTPMGVLPTPIGAEASDGDH